MINLIPILAVLFCVHALAKDSDDISTPGKLNGCLGMKWGTTIEQAKEMMKKLVGMELKTQDPGERTQLVYEGGEVAGLPVNSIALNFYKGEFYCGYIQFQYSLPKLDELTAALTKKHGSPTTRSIESGDWFLASEEMRLLYDFDKTAGASCLELTYTNTTVSRKIPYSALKKEPSVTGKGL